MRMCLQCDQPVLRGEPRRFVGDEMVHEYCVVDGVGGSVCPPPCNLVHAGVCEF